MRGDPRLVSLAGPQKPEIGVLPRSASAPPPSTGAFPRSCERRSESPVIGQVQGGSCGEMFGQWRAAVL